MAIRVIRTPHLFDSGTREIEDVPWGIDATPRALAPGWLDPDQEWAICSRNGEPVDDWDALLADGDTVSFYERPGTFTAPIAAGVTAVAAAGSATAGGISLGAVLAFAAKLVIVVGLNLALRYLLGPSKKPTEPDDESSATFGFANLQENSRAAGEPVPVLYGRHRVAPPIINQYSRNYLDHNGDAFSELFLLMLVSEGPIQAIGDKTADGGPFSVDAANELQTLQIENQPAENFDGVEAHVRLGSNNQTPIAGFAEPVKQFNVEAKLRESETNEPPTTVEATPGVYAANHAEITKWDNHAAYTMGTPHDEFIAVMTFPQGLYLLIGSFAPAGVKIQIRYRRVDDVGVPYGNYVVLPVEPQIFLSKASQFSIEFSHRFFDPDTYVPPGVGNALDFPGVAHTGVTFGIDSNAYPVVSPPDVRFTALMWVRNTGGAFVNQRRFFDWFNSNSGISIGMNGSGLVTVTIGDGTASDTINFAGATIHTNSIWHLLTVTFRANYDQQGNHRLRVYDFGNMIGGEQIITRDLAIDPTLTARIGDDGAGSQEWFGEFDECVFYTRELTPFEINSAVNEANGRPTDADAADVIFGARFDTETDDGTTRYSPEIFGYASYRNLLRFTEALDNGYWTTSGTMSITADNAIAPDGTTTAELLDDDDGAAVATRFVDIDSTLLTDATWYTLSAHFKANTTSTSRLKITQLGGTNNARGTLTYSPLSVAADGSQGLFEASVAQAAEGYVRVRVSLLYDAGHGNGDLRLEMEPSAGTAADQDSAWVWGVQFEEGKVATQYQKVANASSHNALGVVIGATGHTPGVDPAVDATGLVPTPETGTYINDRFLIEVHRITEEHDPPDSTTIQWSSVQFRTFETFEYPGVALLAVRIPATDQLNTSRPLVTTIADGRLVPVWDGASTETPTMVPTWTQNPAWIAADILLDRLYGMGGFHDPEDLDLPSFAAFEQFCDAIVYDGQARKTFIHAGGLNSVNILAPGMVGGVTWEANFVEYFIKDNSLPSNFPAPTFGRVSTGKYITMSGAGSTPAEPQWLTDHLASGAVEIEFVAYDNATAGFFIRGLAHATDTTGSSYSPTAGTLEVEIHETRMEYDGVYDRRDFSAWDAVIGVLQTARAAPIRKGRKVAIFYDDVRSPVGLVGMGDIVAGSWQSNYDGIIDRPNAVYSEFYDRDRNYERDPVADEHPDLVDPTIFSAFRWRRISIEGVTRRSQMRRHLRRDLNVFHLITRGASFKLGLDGLVYQPGDLIAVSHDVPGYGFSGRIWETATVGTQVKLDREIEIEAGKSYQIQIENAASGIRETQSVDTTVSTPAIYAAGSTIELQSAFSFLPTVNDLYAFGDTSKGETKLFAIVERKLTPKSMETELSVLEYDPQVYSDAFGTLPEISPSTLPPPSVEELVPGVRNLKVLETSYRDLSGGVQIELSVSFTHDTQSTYAVGGTAIYVSKGTYATGISHAQRVATLPPRETHHKIRSYPFERDVTYTVWVQPLNRAGAGSHRKFMGWQEIKTHGLVRELPSTPTSFTLNVAGEQAVYEWAGDHQQSQVIEARMGGWILGMPLFTAPAQVNSYGPTPAWTTGPANVIGVTSPDIYARVRLGNGNMSEAVQASFDPTVIGAEGQGLEVSEEDGPWTGTLSNLSTEAPATPGYRPDIELSTRLKPSAGTTHTYTQDSQSFSAPTWIYLEVTFAATQIHPYKLDDLDLMGGVGEPDLLRWTLEGPTHVRAGETANCTVTVEVSTSLTATAGTDWRAYRPGRYYLRSYAVRVTVTRPDTSYDFRIYRLSTRATQAARPLRDPVLERAFSDA